MGALLASECTRWGREGDYVRVTHEVKREIAGRPTPADRVVRLADEVASRA